MPNGNGMGKFDRERTFGIEIEAFNCGAPRLAQAINDAGVDCLVEAYNHDTREHWKIVSDASIRGAHPFELVSPPLKGEAGLREIQTVCGVLKQMGVQVNRSTGLHVHHDASDINLDHVKSVLTMWWKYEDVIQYFLPPSRRANLFCQPAMPRNGEDGTRYHGYNWTPGNDHVQGWKNALDGLRRLSDVGEGGRFQNGRYAPVNCHAISKHGTLEFRSHAGTTEFSKIHAWIVLTQWFVTRAKERGCQARTRMTGRWADDVRFFWKAIDWINLDDAEVIKAKNTLRKRFNHFKEQERGGRANVPSGPLHQVDERGRFRPTAAAEQAEPGEV